ncbi:MAG: hypothetical protein Kow0059_07910 [Candidatus Sumerlaeia bacterium]
MLWFSATAAVLLLAAGLARIVSGGRRLSSPSVFFALTLTLFHLVILGNVYALSRRLTPGALLVLALVEGAVGLIILARKDAEGGSGLLPCRWGLTSNIRVRHMLFLLPLAVPIGMQAAVGLWLGPRFSDAVEYQLIAPVRWVQAKRLVWDGMGSHPQWPPLERAQGFPKTGATTAFWHIALSGDLHPGALAQVSWALLGLAALYALAREVGLRRGAAIAAVWFALLIPESFLQLSEAYVDLSLSSVLTAAVLFLWLFRSRGGWRWLVMSAVAAGLAGGMKATGLLFSVVLGAAAVSGMIRHRWPALPAAAGIGLFACVWLALAGPWYAHNWIAFGNPVYPQRLVAFGRTLAEGPYDKNTFFPMFMQRRTSSYMRAVWMAWREDEAGIGLAPMWSGLGAAFFILGLPSLLAALARAGIERHRAMLFSMAVIGALFIVQPVKWHSRYTLYLAWFAGICVLWVFQRMGRLERLAGTALLAVCFAAQAVKAAPAAGSVLFPPDFWHYAWKTGDVTPLRFRCYPGEYTTRHYVHEHLAHRAATIWFSPNAAPLLLLPRDMTPRLLTFDSRRYGQWLGRLAAEGVEFVYIERPWRMRLWDELLAAIMDDPEHFELIHTWHSNGLYRGTFYSEPLVEQWLFRVRRGGEANEAARAAAEDGGGNP